MRKSTFPLFSLLILIAFCGGARAQSYSQLEQDVLKEINRVRRSPAAYADWIAANRNRLPYTPEPERLKVIDEAIRDLRATPNLPLLTYSALAFRAAKTQLDEQLPTGNYSHAGLDGSRVDQRLRRYGKLTGAYAENAILMNPEDPLTAGRIVLVWIIDDVVSSRGHRRVLLDKNYQVAGIACGIFPNSKIYRNYSVCVANFAQQLQ